MVDFVCSVEHMLLPSYHRGGAGGLVPQALETAGSGLSPDSILSPEHWREMVEERLAEAQGGL